MNLLLLLISLVLSIILYPLGFLYTFLRLSTSQRYKLWSAKFGEILETTAVCVDITGNVFMQEVFNDLLIKHVVEGSKFGEEGETISSVLGKNLEANNLTRVGRFIANTLDRIQPNHCINSIKIK